jgi:hypothetical protein
MFYLTFQLLAFFIFFELTKKVRLSIVANFVATSCALLIGIVGLSLFESLTAFSLSMYWLVLTIVVGVLFVWRRTSSVALLKKCITDVRQCAKDLDTLSVVMVIGVVCILLVSLILGIKAPPNNHDAMTAHMARLIFWVQNKSVAFYPTSEMPQLTLQPYASYKLLNNFLMTGNDYFSHFVQWEAMVISLVVVSMLADRFGFSKKKQIFTVLIAASIPMGVLQSASTQSDYLMSAYIITTCYLLLDFLEKKTLSYINAIGIGVCIGLALLIKSTAVIYLLGFAVSVLFIYITNPKLILRTFAPCIVIITTALLLNSYYMIQTYQAFEHVNPPTTEGEYVYINQQISVPIVIENVIKNILIHVEVEHLYWNSRLNETIFSVAGNLGLNLNNPATNWSKEGWKGVIAPKSDENISGNMLHLGLLFCAFVILGYRLLKRTGSSRSTRILLPTLVSFLTFCVILKWQPWHSRLHLPFFVLLSVFIGDMLFIEHKKRSDVFLSIVVTLLLLVSYKALFFNVTKHIANGYIFSRTRQEQYLISGLTFGYGEYLPLAEEIKNQRCEELHMVMSYSEYQYPLWVLTDFKVKLVHTHITNLTSKYIKNEPIHGKWCYLISANRPCGKPIMLTLPDYQQKTFGKFTLMY